MHLQVLSAVLSIGSLLAPVANAKIDGPCSNAAIGMTGVCLTTAQCAGGLNPPLVGFYTDGDCPDDPANVKCCFIAGCSVTDGALGYGFCKNTGEGCGGGFVADRCPGPSDVECC